jgi:hypothetical protein
LGTDNVISAGVIWGAAGPGTIAVVGTVTTTLAAGVADAVDAEVTRETLGTEMAEEIEVALAVIPATATSFHSKLSMSLFSSQVTHPGNPAFWWLEGTEESVVSTSGVSVDSWLYHAFNAAVPPVPVIRQVIFAPSSCVMVAEEPSCVQLL